MAPEELVENLEKSIKPMSDPTGDGLSLQDKETSSNAERFDELNSILGAKYNSMPKLPLGYEDLPKTVLVNIFSHFSEMELSLGLSPVCRSWRLATKSPSLWKRLKFEGDTASTNRICQLLRSAPQLESLELIEVPDVVSVIRQLCRCNQSLQRLVVKNCTKSYGHKCLTEKMMKNLIVCCKQISYLNMEGTQFIPKRFVHDLVRLSHLKSINLSKNQHLRVKDLITLSFNCRSLEELHIGNRRTCNGQLPLTDADVIVIFANLAHLLKSVTFDMRDLGSASYEAIFKCSKLEELSLNNSFYLPGDLFHRIDEFLPQIKSLKIVSAVQLTAENFCTLFSTQRKSMKNLCSLKLHCCWKLSDESLVAIVDTCAANLQYLSVRSCKLLTSGSIIYAIKRCPKLQYLDIAHVFNIGDPLGLTGICENIPLNLEILIVEQDLQKEEILKQIHTAMPELKIKCSISELHNIKTVFAEEILHN